MLLSHAGFSNTRGYISTSSVQNYDFKFHINYIILDATFTTFPFPFNIMFSEIYSYFKCSPNPFLTSPSLWQYHYHRQLQNQSLLQICCDWNPAIFPCAHLHLCRRTRHCWEFVNRAFCFVLFFLGTQEDCPIGTDGQRPFNWGQVTQGLHQERTFPTTALSIVNFRGHCASSDITVGYTELYNSYSAIMQAKLCCGKPLKSFF